MASKKELLQKFLKGIETGDAMAAAVVNEARYIQHNPQTHEGGEGIAALFERLSRTEPKVKFARVFEDGDYAFAHIEYDFSSVRIAFEVFRFEDNQAVEHWDNIQAAAGPNVAGRGMIDGEARISDIAITEDNRELARTFVEDVLIAGQLEKMTAYVDTSLIQHDPGLGDGIQAWRAALEFSADEPPVYQYQRLHRVLAEGNFVLCACEGTKNGIHSGIYDLYRLQDDKIAEHWNTVEAVPPRSEWNNQNGKF